MAPLGTGPGAQGPRGSMGALEQILCAKWLLPFVIQKSIKQQRDAEWPQRGNKASKKNNKDGKKNAQQKCKMSKK